MAHKGEIYYIFHGRFPSEKAHALFAAKTCEAFVGEGYAVEIIVPNRAHEDGDPQTFFKLKTSLPVTYIRTLDFAKMPVFRRIGYYLSHIFFTIGLVRYLKKVSEPQDIFYTNQAFVLPWLPKKHKVVYELHDFPERKFGWYAWLFKHAHHILSTNTWKTEQYKKHFPQLASRVFTEPNAVDVETFAVALSKDSARDTLSIPQDKKVVVYTGHLYGWKGVHTLAKAADELPDDFLVYFVGGHPQDVAKFKEAYDSKKNIRIMGHQPHHQMPVWQKAADVLVIPNTATEEISMYHTSPMKLFEYMASGVPIVASDIPSIREVAGEGTVVYAKPDDAHALAHALKEATELDTTALVASALAAVKEHTWEARAQRICAQIEG